VDNSQRIARKEIFGPVMSVIPFSDVDEAVRLANDNESGLAAAVWTKDITKAVNTAKALRSGIVWINDTLPAPAEAPWGWLQAVRIGRELGSQGVDDSLELKHVSINLG
jgi:betaine-aldehyde dehydrogenase